MQEAHICFLDTGGRFLKISHIFFSWVFVNKIWAAHGSGVLSIGCLNAKNLLQEAWRVKAAYVKDMHIATPLKMH